YSFTPLVAQETIIIPPGGGSGMGVGPTSKYSNKIIEVQNPVFNDLKIFLPEKLENKSILITLLNPNGQAVLVQKSKNIEREIHLDIDYLLPGIYFLHLQTDSINQTFKIVKPF